MIANDVEHAEIKTQIERIANDIHLHFKDEEKELSTVEFDLIEHASIHRNLIEELENIRSKHTQDLVEDQSFYSFIIGKVVIGHILSEDHKFYAAIQKAKA